MRVLTWNMNGIRAVINRHRNMKALLEALSADIICLQETKAQLDSELAVVEGWESFFAYSTCASGPGYAGVATYCRTATASVPLAVEHGLTGAGATAGARLDNAAAAAASPGPTSQMLCEALGVELEQLAAVDREARALITDHGQFMLVNLYGPAITSEERVEERMAFKMLFYQVLELRLQQWLAAGKCCLVVGDLNISPAAIDSCHPAAEFDHQRCDRLWLNKMLHPQGPGLVDAFRMFHPSRRNAYTCWSTVTGARINNYGTRIDHILAAGPVPGGLAAAAEAATASAADGSKSHGSSSRGPPCSSGAAAAAPYAGTEAAAGSASRRFSSLITGCDIMVDFQGSDHAPVWADLAIPLDAMPAGHAAPAGAASRLFPAKQQTIKLWLQRKHQPQQSQQQQQQHHSQQPLQQCATAGMPPQPQDTGASAQLGQYQHGSLLPSTAAAGVAVAAGAHAAGAVHLARTNSKGASTGSSSGKAGSTVGKRKGDTHAVAAASSKRSQSSLLGLGFQRQVPAPPRQQPAAVAPSQHMPDAGPAELQLGAGASVCHQQQRQQQQQQPWLPEQLASQQSSRGAAVQALQQQQQQHRWQEAAPAAGAADATTGVEQALQQQHQEASAAWQRISQKMQPPKCHCKEPSVVRVSKKANENYLRQFYTCARPAGPPGVGRCNFFQWATAPKVKPKAPEQARAGRLP